MKEIIEGNLKAVCVSDGRVYLEGGGFHQFPTQWALSVQTIKGEWVCVAWLPSATTQKLFKAELP